MKRVLTLITAGVLLAMVPAVAADRKNKQETTTRTLQGVVTDAAEQPVPGAVVQLKDTKSLQIRSYYTKENGRYQFAGLSPDIDYEVKADHAGSSSSTKTVSSFDSRKQAVINLRIEKK